EFEKSYPKDLEGSIWKAMADADVAGDRVEAIKVLRETLEKEPDNLAAVALLSEQVAVLGRPGDAAAILKDYLARHPDATKPLEPAIRDYLKSAQEPGKGG